MTKTVFWSVCLMTMLTTTHVYANEYECRNVGGTEEWTLLINLKQELAGFFDNNSTVTVSLKTIKIIESIPPQVEYVFEGDDRHGGADAKLRIFFNYTLMKARVSFLRLGEPSQTLEALNGCEEQSL